MQDRRFLSIYGVMHAVVNSRNYKVKELKDWILRVVVPRCFNKMIEEKNTQLTLINDDLTELDLVRQLEYNNTGLQGEISEKDERLAVFRQQYVPLLESEEKNDGMIIITKTMRSQGTRSSPSAVNMAIRGKRSEWS